MEHDRPDRGPAEPAPSGDRTTGRVRRAFELARFAAGTLALFSLVAGAGALLLATAPVLGGFDPVVITSGSMQPNVRPGDVLLIAPGLPARPTPGQIVQFRDPSRPATLTHRIVGLDDTGAIITKGDANPSADSSPVAPDAVAGRAVLLVPFVGVPRLWFDDGDWRSLAALATVIVVAAWATKFVRHEEYDPWTRRELTGGAR